MTTDEKESAEAITAYLQSKALRNEFERAWVESLKIKAATFAHIPASALAYEMAWHGFRAGKASNGR